MTHEAGKGDTQRPTNHEKFSSNYDTIDWSAKEVTCPRCGEKYMLSSKHPNKHYCVLPEETK
jgi:ribosomal protein S27AE